MGSEIFLKQSKYKLPRGQEKQYISGTGLIVTQHALRRWSERVADEITLFNLEASLHRAIKLSKKNMYDFKGEIRISNGNVDFVLINRTVVTCYRTKDELHV